MRAWAVLAAFALLLGVCSADIYMHNMRGSNNRLDSDGTNVGNNKRLFDSQNNDKGGYNHGYMYFYAGSKLTLEWTNQHGAGANPNVHSEIIIQYLCDDLAPGVRDGTREDTITLDRADDYTLGRHETAVSYARCNVRERNKGLYTADQNLRNDVGALATRQNPGGTRFGFECTEERDYYPYWHPTEWRDLAVLTSNTSRCAYYQKESQNVKNKGHCELNKDQQKQYDAAVKQGVTNFTASGIVTPLQPWSYNNAANCTANAFIWKEDSAFGIPAPYCGPVPTSRDNHLGNAKAQGTGRGVYASMYNMTVPSVGNDLRRCVLRIRYNISTGDFDGWNTFAAQNRQVFPQRGNPTVTIYNASFPVSLQLQVNTDQYFRTFQDRSHVWDLYPDRGECSGGHIYNLNVRGKRGNIVQVYPAVEYDFVPERLHVRSKDCVHLQWTGSNTNPDNTGQGVQRSDRSNFMQMLNHSSNYPANLSSINFITKGQHGRSLLDTLRLFAVANQPNNQAELNDASPYFDGGLLRFSRGTYFYLSTRNNNFSNRSQKGVIISGHKDDGLSAAIIAAIVIFSVIVVAGIIIAWAVVGTRAPDSTLGTSWAATRDFFTGFVDH